MWRELRWVAEGKEVLEELLNSLICVLMSLKGVVVNVNFFCHMSEVVVASWLKSEWMSQGGNLPRLRRPT